MLTAGWLASGPLHGFRAGTIGPVSLLLLTGAALITAAGARAAAALPRPPASGGRDGAGGDWT